VTFCQGYCDKSYIETIMVLAIAPARVPVMDWMLEDHMLEIVRGFCNGCLDGSCNGSDII